MNSTPKVRHTVSRTRPSPVKRYLIFPSSFLFLSLVHIYRDTVSSRLPPLGMLGIEARAPSTLGTHPTKHFHAVEFPPDCGQAHWGPDPYRLMQAPSSVTFHRARCVLSWLDKCTFNNFLLMSPTHLNIHSHPTQVTSSSPSPHQWPLSVLSERTSSG